MAKKLVPKYQLAGFVKKPVNPFHDFVEEINKPKPILNPAAFGNKFKNRHSYSLTPEEEQALYASDKQKAEQERVNQIKKHNQEVSATRAIDEGTYFTLPDGSTKKHSDMDFREKRYVEGQALRNRTKWDNNNPEETAWYNPLALVGNMAASIGEAPYVAKQTGSNLPYFTAIGTPLAVGRLAGIGAKTTKQFVNNLANPLAGTGNLIDNIGNKYLPNAYKANPFAFKPNPEAYYRMIGEKGYDDAIESGVIRANPTNIHPFDKTPIYDRPYFSVGKPLDKNWKSPLSKKKGSIYPGPNMVEVNNVNKFHPTNDLVATPNQQLNILDNDTRFFKEDWLRGYKEIPKPKSNFQSEKAVSDVLNPIKEIVKNPKEFVKQLGKTINDELLYPIKYSKKIKEYQKYAKNQLAELNNPETINRLQEIGINPDKFFEELKNTRFQSKPYSSSFTGNDYFPDRSKIINVDFRQLKKLKKDGYNLGMKEVTDHEIGHLMQTGSVKTPSEFFKSQQPNTGPTLLDSYTDVLEHASPDVLGVKAKEDLDYFLKANKPSLSKNKLKNEIEFHQKTERLPFLRETKRELVNQNILKDIKSNVTPEMLRELANRNTGNRILGFTKTTGKNYNFLSGLLNKTPVIAAPILAGTALSQKQQGGIITDPEGYYNKDNQGKPVIIPSNQITMKNQKGKKKLPNKLWAFPNNDAPVLMEKGNDYFFPNSTQVLEQPFMQKGGKIQPLIVNNPNDKRLKAYSDSLNLYNSGVNRTKILENFGKKNNLGIVNSSFNFLPAEHKTIAPIGAKDFIREEILKLSPEKKLEVNDLLENLSKNKFFGQVPNYKKPTQPVTYQKPQRNPDPVNLNKERQLVFNNTPQTINREILPQTLPIPNPVSINQGDYSYSYRDETAPSKKTTKKLNSKAELEALIDFTRKNNAGNFLNSEFGQNNGNALFNRMPEFQMGGRQVSSLEPYKAQGYVPTSNPNQLVKQTAQNTSGKKMSPKEWDIFIKSPQGMAWKSKQNQTDTVFIQPPVVKNTPVPVPFNKESYRNEVIYDGNIFHGRLYTPTTKTQTQTSEGVLYDRQNSVYIKGNGFEPEGAPIPLRPGQVDTLFRGTRHLQNKPMLDSLMSLPRKQRGGRTQLNPYLNYGQVFQQSLGEHYPRPIEKDNFVKENTAPSYSELRQTNKTYMQKGGLFDLFDEWDNEDEQEVQPQQQVQQEQTQSQVQQQDNSDEEQYNMAMDIAMSTNPYLQDNSVQNKFTPVSPNETINQVKDYYLSKGYDKSFVAGVLGNIYTESNGLSTRQEEAPTSGQGGYGLFQHTGSRRRELFNWAKNNGMNPNDPITQAKFAEQESEFQTAAKASKGKSPEEAALLFEKHFEKAGIKRNGVRVNAAKSFYNKFEQGGQYDLTAEEIVKLKKQGYKLKQIY